MTVHKVTATTAMSLSTFSTQPTALNLNNKKYVTLLHYSLVQLNIHVTHKLGHFLYRCL